MGNKNRICLAPLVSKAHHVLRIFDVDGQPQVYLHPKGKSVRLEVIVKTSDGFIRSYDKLIEPDGTTGYFEDQVYAEFFPFIDGIPDLIRALGRVA